MPPETRAFFHHILHIINSGHLACYISQKLNLLPYFQPFWLFNRLAGQNLLYALSYRKKPIYCINTPLSVDNLRALQQKRWFFEQQLREEGYANATSGMHMHNKGSLDNNTKRKLDLQSLCEWFNTLDPIFYIGLRWLICKNSVTLLLCVKKLLVLGI